MTENDKIKAIIAGLEKDIAELIEEQRLTECAITGGEITGMKNALHTVKKYLPTKLFIPCENCKEDLPPMVLRIGGKYFCSQDCLEKYLEE